MRRTTRERRSCTDAYSASRQSQRTNTHFIRGIQTQPRTGAGIIVIVLLASPIGSLITFLCVASSIVELVGLFHFYGNGIDSVVVIFLVISLGLAVDYSVHVAHGFLAIREADMNERLRRTLVVRPRTLPQRAYNAGPLIRNKRL